jgi:CubicO group peptidase (beta-lactamase class C family)
MIKRSGHLLLFCVLAGFLPLLTASPVTAVSSLENKVDSYLQPLADRDLISGSVLIAKEGKILLAKGYGPANREYGIPNGPETKFRLGSITKQFTAMAILILEETGLLSVDDTIDKYYPGYPQGERVTIHHLLTHTSGINNYNNLPDYHEKMMLSWSIEEVIDWFKSDSLLFEPGTDWAYSNSGYVLLAYIIEKVSGQSYEEFLAENIFEPLKMTDSGQDKHFKIVKNRAAGHAHYGLTVEQALYRDMPFTSGAGSLYSSVKDLFLWDQALYSEKLVMKATLDRIFTPCKNGYGYGWFIGELFGKKQISHRGGINGFLTNIARFIDDGVLVVSLFNYESVFAIPAMEGLAAIALGEEYEPLLVDHPVAIPPMLLSEYCGRYRINPETVLEVRTEGPALTVQHGDDPRFRAIPQDQHKFFVEEMHAMITFERGEDGNVSRMLIVRGAHRFMATK